MPSEIPETGELIIIEGVVNTTDAVATVRLTHPIVLNSEDEVDPETGATVTIHSENGRTYLLAETSPGNYTLTGLDIKPGVFCHLTVSTRNGGKYESEVVEMKQTPPIDSVYFNYTSDGVEVLVDTHDPSGKSQYYEWKFDETWEYVAPYVSFLKVVPGGEMGQSVIRREPDDFAYRCWRTIPSTQITIGTTDQLAADIVSRKQLVFIPVGSQKVSIRYSVLVKQRALTEEEYIYLTQLQETTESLGGLFDPQPAQVYGNIKKISENGATAIGYFSGGSYDQQRAFQDHNDLPPVLMVPPPRPDCTIDTVCYFPKSYSPIRCVTDLTNLPLTENVVGEIWMGITLVGFTTTYPECADCRKQGGILKRPAFW
jgi:hypothetical protein